MTCAVLMPHAPILVPTVGGDRGDTADFSRRAMREAAANVVKLRLESLVIISPHSPRKPQAFGIWEDARLHGSFGQFGVPAAQVNLPNDRELAGSITAEAATRDLKTRP